MDTHLTKFRLPWPPSLNRYYRTWKGRVLIAEDGRKYRKTVGKLAMVNRFGNFGNKRIKVEVEALPPDRRRRDLDNLYKGVLDSLQHAGVYDDDGQIDDLHTRS